MLRIPVSRILNAISAVQCSRVHLLKPQPGAGIHMQAHVDHGFANQQGGGVELNHFYHSCHANPH